MYFAYLGTSIYKGFASMKMDRVSAPIQQCLATFLLKYHYYYTVHGSLIRSLTTNFLELLARATPENTIIIM